MTGNPVGVDLFDPRGTAALPAWAAGTPAARLPYHLALAECADAIVIAPASATTIARLAYGLADDLLSSCVLATTRPVFVAPAMNSRMWLHPATQANVRALQERGVVVLEPDTGKMAWNTEGEGPGRLPEPHDLAERIFAKMEKRRELEGVNVVVSSGGTEEPIDAVRVIANRSSGKMGVALAAEARDRGADVVLVAARMSVAPPPGIRVVRAPTAAAMKDAVLGEAKHADIVVMAAAVADWRPAGPEAGKRKRAEGAPTIRLEATDDVLLALAKSARGAFRVGFALETDDAITNGRGKLRAKDLDLLVVNDATEPGSGFDVDTNRVVLLARDGTRRDLPLLPKREVAERIWDRVRELRAKGAPRTRKR
jgi:phosphopantothenoylcysteine decarboxylase/phosphopantothenate--cysteine ligase